MVISHFFEKPFFFKSVFAQHSFFTIGFYNKVVWLGRPPPKKYRRCTKVFSFFYKKIWR